ncbi:MAG TPA: hypothetical protein VHC18_24760 [Amycolatopsis sp.]|nr:hypothetical protein [Amycolatopsis sp.]
MAEPAGRCGRSTTDNSASGAICQPFAGLLDPFDDREWHSRGR